TKKLRARRASFKSSKEVRRALRSSSSGKTLALRRIQPVLNSEPSVRLNRRDNEWAIRRGSRSLKWRLRRCLAERQNMNATWDHRSRPDLNRNRRENE